jgi:hypothetical protein
MNETAHCCDAKQCTAAKHHSFNSRNAISITMVRFDIVDFFKTSGKIANEDSADGTKEVVTLENFTGTVIWKKQKIGSSHDEAGIEEEDEVVFLKDVKSTFPLQPTLQGSTGGIMKTGIGAMEKWSSAAAKPKSVAVKVEKVEPGTKKASIVKQPSEQPTMIISNAVKPPPVMEKVVKKKPAIKKNKPAAKKVEQALDDSILESPDMFKKAKTGTKELDSSSSSSIESSGSSIDRHHANLFAAGPRSAAEKGDEKKEEKKAAEDDKEEKKTAEDDKEEKKTAEDEVVDAVVQVKDPKKARGRPRNAAPAAAAAAAGDKNNKNKNKVNDFPTRPATRGAAARK